MAVFNKTDLKYTYSWSTDGGDNPKLKGEPDSSLLDRTEGYEVLYLIQKSMEAWGLKLVASGHKIERMIKNDVPSSIRTQIGIKDWIRINWEKY